MWQSLDGYKTLIGSIALTIATFCTEVLIGIWAVEWPWLPGTISTLNWVGLIFGGTGLIHKGAKALSATPPTQV